MKKALKFESSDPEVTLRKLKQHYLKLCESESKLTFLGLHQTDNEPALRLVLAKNAVATVISQLEKNKEIK